MVSRSAIIKDIRGLLNENPSEWVDIGEIILKHCEGLERHNTSIVRQTIRTIIEEMREQGEITFNNTEASNALSIMQGTQYVSNSLRIRTTMKYDKEQEQKNQTIHPNIVIQNSGTIANSPIGNIHSDLSHAFETNNNNPQIIEKAHPKKRMSVLEKTAAIAGILAVIITIMIYFKIYPFNN